VRPRHLPPVRRAWRLVPRGHELSAGRPPGNAFPASGGSRAACLARSAPRSARVASRCRPGGTVRGRHVPPGRRAPPFAPKGHELSAGRPLGDGFCTRGGPRAACPDRWAARPARVAASCRPGGAVRPRPAPPGRRARRARPPAPRGHELSAGGPPGDGFRTRAGSRAACPDRWAARPARVATRCRSGGAVRPRHARPARADARGNVGGRG